MKKLLFLIAILLAVCLSIINARTSPEGRQHVCTKKEVELVMKVICYETSSSYNKRGAYYSETDSSFNPKEQYLLWRSVFNINENTTGIYCCFNSN